MIQSGRASLVVLSTGTTPEFVSKTLALEPTEVRRRGSILRSGRVRESHVWSLEVDTARNTADDQTGAGALQELLARCTPAFGRVGDLPADCDARVWWWADSDSAQGGFVLPIRLTEAIAALGVDVYATVHFNDELMQ